MQTNSLLKLDTLKKFLLLSKTILSPPKQNKQDFQILSISPPFCHVLTKTTQSEGRQKTYAIENKRK